jgi:type I restriction enzyme, S subunit
MSKAKNISSITLADKLEDLFSGEWGDEDGVELTKVLRTTNFTNCGIIDFSDVVSRSIKQKIVLRKKLLPGDIIIEKSGGSPAQPVGRVVYFDLDDTSDYVCNNFSAVLRFSSDLHPRYLFHLLLANYQAGKSEKYQNKTTGIRNLKLSNYLQSIQIPDIALSEQKRIAAILDSADAIRTKRKAAISKLDELAQSVFIEMFGNLKNNEKEWEMKLLGDCFKVEPQNGLYKPSFNYGSGTPILRIDCFYDGKVTDISTLKRVRLDKSEIAKYKLSENDIVINRVNSIEYLGKSALIPKMSEPTVYESNMMRFSLKNKMLDPLFVIYVLNSQEAKAKIKSRAKKSINQASINQQDVRIIDIPVPPLSLQTLFAKYVRQIDELVSREKVALHKEEVLFSSLQHRAFAGEL